jgi:hypothetical protein
MTLATIPQIHGQLMQATTPAQTREVEKVSRAAIAYAEEQSDYDLYMQAWQVYLSARRKTTALVKYDLERNIDVTAEGFGFTKMQWSRRLKELSVPQEKIDEYFDKLVSNGWQPSIAGMLRDSEGKEIDREARAITELKRGVKTLRDEFKYKTKQIEDLVWEAIEE